MQQPHLSKQKILQIVKQDPSFSKAVLVLEKNIEGMPVTDEGIDKLVRLLELAVNNLDKWPQIRQAAIEDGMMDETTLPEQVDKLTLMSVLVVLYGLQERGKQKKEFARGGLARVAQSLQNKGRYGDTMLAHINPREAAMLQAHGGSGTLNPETGLPEFFSLGDLFKAAVVVGLMYVSGGTLAPALGAMMGSTIGGTIAAGALTGALGSAITGGDWKQGAVMGGLGGGLGGMAGGAANSAMNLGLGAAGQAALGSGIVGGLASAAQGKDFVQGAAQGAIGGYLGNEIGGLGAGTGWADAVKAGGTQFGNALTAGYDPKQAALMGGLTGLATGLQRPAEAVVAQYKVDQPELGTGLSGINDKIPGTELSTQGELNPVPEVGQGAPLSMTGAQVDMTPAPKGGLGELFTMKNALLASTAASLLNAPEEAKAAVNAMTPQQKEMFNRPNVTWDWNRMQKDASANNMSLAAFMSQNWPRISGYAQPGGDARQGQYAVAQPRPEPTVPPTKLARGGLAQIMALAKGGGSGRDDTIDAKLSDGEYIMDAETVALLGDGSNDEGARRLDGMRSALRAHKGKTLARGKISPNARSPLAYLKGVA